MFVGQSSRRLLNIVSWIATAVTALVTALILRRAVGDIENRQRRVPVAVAAGLGAAAVVTALTFYPLVKAYSLGQIQTWLDAVFALLVLCWITGRRSSTGLLLGLLCLVKPTFLPLFGWALVRRQWRVLAAGAATIAVGGMTAVYLYGVDNALGYVRVLSFLSSRGEGFYANQSFNGAVNRWVHNGPNLEWQYFQFPPVHPAVAAVTAIALVALITVAWIVPARTREEGGAIDLCITALSVTMSAPIAWEHHYGIMLPIYAVVTPRLLVDRPFGAWTLPALTVSFVVASQFFPQTNRFANTVFNPLQSYLLGAALILLALLYAIVKGPTTDVRATA